MSDGEQKKKTKSGSNKQQKEEKKNCSTLCTVASRDCTYTNELLAQFFPLSSPWWLLLVSIRSSTARQFYQAAIISFRSRRGWLSFISLLNLSSWFRFARSQYLNNRAKASRLNWVSSKHARAAMPKSNFWPIAQHFDGFLICVFINKHDTLADLIARFERSRRERERKKIGKVISWLRSARRFAVINTSICYFKNLILMFINRQV